MKKVFLFLAVLIFLSGTNVFAQSIGFNHPTNGGTYTGASTTSTVSIPCDYGYTLTYYPACVSNYSKLIVDNSIVYSSLGDGTIPNYLYLSAGIHTLRAELWELFLGESQYHNTASSEITIYVKFIISAVNNFGSGTISLENSTVTSGASTTKYIGETVSVAAIDQYGGTIYRVWNTSGTNNSYWNKNGTPISNATSRNYNYTVTSTDNGTVLTADMKKRYNVAFSNSGRSITANGTTGTSSVTNSTSCRTKHCFSFYC